ncbi:MAG: NADH-quinone oxidoreductase subunit N [Chloroflexia bacterium]
MADGIELLLFLPELLLALLGLLILGLDLFYLRRRADGAARSNFLGYFTLASLVVVSIAGYLWGPRSLLIGLKPLEGTFARILSLLQSGGPIFGGVFRVDGLTQFFRVIFLLVAALVLLLSLDRKWGEHEGEYYALLVFALLGMSLMVGAAELITIYVALELTSISLYLLTAFDFNRRSLEAGLKYFLFGAFSSAILLYGMSLVYGFTGTTTLQGVAGKLTEWGGLPGLLSPAGRGLLLGLVFLVTGFGFKLALVPFHAWAPDVYEGAPTPITAFISTGSKAASFVVVLRVFQQFLGAAAGEVRWEAWREWGWSGLLAVLAMLTFTAANLMALPQRNVKRLLAYSSIAHAGYMLIGVLLHSRTGAEALFYYLMAYVLTNVGAFAAIIAVSRAVGGEELQHLAGLSKRSLPLAGALTILLLSLGGLPPLAGFFAKFWLFWATFEEGLVWLAAVALVNTVIAFYYYLRVLKAVWFEAPAEDTPVRVSEAVSVTLGVTTGLVIFLGIMAHWGLGFVSGAVGALFPRFPY